jgi:hypothetical protein
VAAINFETEEQTTDQAVVLNEEEPQDLVIPAWKVPLAHEPSALGNSPQDVVSELQAALLFADAEESTVGDTDASPLDHLQVFELVKTEAFKLQDPIHVKAEHVESAMELEGGRRRAPYTKQYIVFESAETKRAGLEHKHGAQSLEQPVVVAKTKSIVDAPSGTGVARLETKSF